MGQEISTLDYHIDASGETAVTEKLQELIDAAAAVKGRVVLTEGRYLTGSLFLHSNMEFHLEKGAVLLGSRQEKAYPLMQTRAAGIEMEWMGAVLNAIDCENILMSGEGTIDGQGEIWWEKFWGRDRLGGMCREYEEKGLRWAADYDCIRPRLIQIRNCKNVICRGIHLTRSGFWNLHTCYSQDVHIDGIRITNCQGPSTDGIDIDSCERVLIERCDISCNDDNIVLKAGMNADGMRMNRICRNVEVRNCILREGMGMAFGSDMAGGIQNVSIHDLTMIGTLNGIYIKSSKIRGGFIRNAVIERVKMRNVCHTFNLNINWFPEFSYPEIPTDYYGKIPDRWHLLTEHVPEGKGMPVVEKVTISDLVSEYDEDYEGESNAFYVEAYGENPIREFCLKGVKIKAKNLGEIHRIKGWRFENVELDLYE